MAVFNRKAQTEKFLTDFSKITYPNYELILVDDGSTDGTAAMIASRFPTVRLLKTAGDLWWSKCTNLGVADALARGAHYILTINDDVDFPENFLSNLAGHAEAHPRTLVGCLIRDFDVPDRIWYAGGKRSLLFGELQHRGSAGEGEIVWLTGMGTLIPASVFAEVGYYDDVHFPQYSGDADLSMRARKAGYRLEIEPLSVLYNRVGESGDSVVRRGVTLRNFFTPLFSRKSTSEVRAKFYLIFRHWPLLIAPVAFVLFYAKLFLKQLYRLIFPREVSPGH